MSNLVWFSFLCLPCKKTSTRVQYRRSSVFHWETDSTGSLPVRVTPRVFFRDLNSAGNFSKQDFQNLVFTLFSTLARRRRRQTVFSITKYNFRVFLNRSERISPICLGKSPGFFPDYLSRRKIVREISRNSAGKINTGVTIDGFRCFFWLTRGRVRFFWNRRYPLIWSHRAAGNSNAGWWRM